MHVDSSYLCASVEIGAIGRLLQYMHELAMAEPREPAPLEPAQPAPSGWCTHSCQMLSISWCFLAGDW